MHRPSWDYRDISQLTQAFADTEKDGAWGIAAEIAGSLNAGGDATAATVSCATSGNCTVGGVFQDNANRHQPSARRRRSPHCRAPRPATAWPAGLTAAA